MQKLVELKEQAYLLTETIYHYFPHAIELQLHNCGVDFANRNVRELTFDNIISYSKDTPNTIPYENNPPLYQSKGGIEKILYQKFEDLGEYYRTCEKSLTGNCNVSDEIVRDINQGFTSLRDKIKEFVKKIDLEPDDFRGNFIYLDNVQSENIFCILNFSNPQRRNNFYCLDYFNDNDSLKRIAIQVATPLGKRFSMFIKKCIGDGFFYSGNRRIRIERINELILFYELNKQNEKISLLEIICGDSTQNAFLHLTESIKARQNEYNINTIFEWDRSYYKIKSGNGSLIAKIFPNDKIEIDEKKAIIDEYNNYAEKNEKVFGSIAALFNRKEEEVKYIIKSLQKEKIGYPSGSVNLNEYFNSKFNIQGHAYIGAATIGNELSQELEYNEKNPQRKSIDERQKLFILLKDIEILKYIDKESSLGFSLESNQVNVTETDSVLLRTLKNSDFIQSKVKELNCSIYVWIKFEDIDINNHFSSYFYCISTDANDYKQVESNSEGFLRFLMTIKRIKQIETDRKLQSQMRESAKAAIMARNMSHNLGSHIMSYVHYDLSNISSEKGKDVLGDYYKEENGKIYQAPYLLGLGRFIDYLQERQDFIATISSGFRPSMSPIFLKEDFLDIINMDENGNNEKETDNLLLKYIAKSENISRERIKITASEKFLESIVSIPGGTLGRQGLFSIFENIIRNIAKHDNFTENLKLHFNLYDHDDGEVTEMGYSNYSDIINLYVITITSNIECSQKTIDHINMALKEDYYETDTNKGIKEIRISATWLRGENEDSLESGEKAPSVSVRRCHNKESGTYTLEYIVCLKKHIKYLYVTNGDSSPISNSKDVMCISESEFNNLDISYDIAIAQNEEVYNNIRQYSSNKIVIFTENMLNGGNLIDEEVWKSYYNIPQDGKPSEIIYIDDEKNDRSEQIAENARDLITYSDKIFDTDKTILEYRSHNSSDREFVAFWKKRTEKGFQNLLAIDEISGANLSKRLVRKCPLDLIWYYKHRNALKSKVAIVDERFFQHIFSIKEEDINKCINAFRLIESLPDKLEYDNDLLTFGDIKLFNDTNNNEEKTSIVRKYTSLKPKLYSPAIYHEKGVDAFLIEPITKYKCIILGLSQYSSDKPIEETNFFADSLCVISYKKGEPGNKFSFEGSIEKYDYISIHQGIIDKLFDAFDISTEPEKRELIKKIYQIFTGRRSENEVWERFTVHSGRGKITKDKLPMAIPFLPLSSIKHAIYDCKYSLVDLLDNAVVCK